MSLNTENIKNFNEKKNKLSELLKNSGSKKKIKNVEMTPKEEATIAGPRGLPLENR